MFVPSRLALWQVLAVVLLITLAGFGTPALRAQGQGCQQQSSMPQKECPAPVLREKPTVNR